MYLNNDEVLLCEIALLRYQSYIDNIKDEQVELLSNLGLLYYDKQLDRINKLLRKLFESEDIKNEV